MRLLYLHLPLFPVQRRVLETPSLTGKAVVFAEEVKGQRQIAFASPAAQAAGIRPGFTLAAATALLPSLRHFPYQPRAESAALLALGECLLSIAPQFQVSVPDGLWLDASAAGLSNGEEGLCRRALEICASQGFQALATVASEAFTARVLARHSSKPLQVVLSRESATALFRLPLRALAESASSLVATLGSLGLTTLGEVASLPVGAVVARMGAAGLHAHRLCRGEDDSQFVPAALPEILEECIDLDWPAESLEPMLFALKTILDRLCARLSGRRKAAVRLTLTLKLDPTGEEKVGLVLARPCARSKLLLDLTRHRIADLSLPRPISRLQIRVDESCDDPGNQLVLGDHPQGDSALEVVLARLSTALGEQSLFAAEVKPSHRPESAYTHQPFRPPPPDSGLMAAVRGQIVSRSPQPDPALAQRPARIFSRPATLKVDLDPRGELVGARFLGKRRKATAIAGPERLCGEWWGEDPYGRDYYWVHFEGFGPTWIYRDTRDGLFYLQGMFD